MKFELENTIDVLSATPKALNAMLGSVSDDWTASAGNKDNWEPFDVVGHLIHGEETDWVPRARMILEQGAQTAFVPFEMLAHFERSRGKSMADLLREFETLRERNLAELKSWNIGEEQLALRGIHPELGEVTLSQLLATWAVHDLNHIRQIAAGMARRYDAEVGPWKQYLSILK